MTVPFEFATYLIDDVRWGVLEARAAEKDVVASRRSDTRVWNDRHNLCGEIGEWLFGWLVGAERTGPAFDDGGCDFGRVDVKASSRFASPLLLRLASDKLKADRFALVAVDLDGRRARYVGYATRAVFAAAPLRDYGYGPTRTLTPADLVRDLPELS